MLSSSLHQVVRRSRRDPRGTGVYRRRTHADPNTSSACDSKRPPDGLPVTRGRSERLCGDPRQHQAFAAKLTPGGGLLESGTKKSGDSGWLGSTRLATKTETPSPARKVSWHRERPGQNLSGIVKTTKAADAGKNGRRDLRVMTEP